MSLNDDNRGGARICRRRAGFLDRGVNNRIEGIFLCIRMKFPVNNSPTDSKFFPDGGLTLPDEKHPLWRQPWMIWITGRSCEHVIVPVSLE